MLFYKCYVLPPSAPFHCTICRAAVYDDKFNRHIARALDCRFNHGLDVGQAIVCTRYYTDDCVVQACSLSRNPMLILTNIVQYVARKRAFQLYPLQADVTEQSARFPKQVNAL